MVFSGASAANPSAASAACDDRLEGPVGDVRHAGPADQAGGEEPVLVRLLRLLEAVGGHQDRAGEFGELLLLILPGAAVIPDEVLVLLQARIAVRREHLAVRVDVDPRSFRLLEQLLQVLEVVPGDDDRLALDRPDAHSGRDRMAVRAGVRRVEQAHDLEVDLADLQRLAEQRADVRRVRAQPGERLVEERVHLVAFLPENLRVVRVRRDAFQAVNDEFLQAGDVVAERLLAAQDGDLLDLAVQALRVSRRLPRRRAGKRLGRLARGLAGGLVFRLHARAHFGGLGDHAAQGGRVEIDVGQRREDRLDRENVRLMVLHTQFPRARRVHGKALARVDQQVLQSSDFRVLPAHPADRARDSFRRLLALIAKHCNFSLLKKMEPQSAEMLTRPAASSGAS